MEGCAAIRCDYKKAKCHVCHAHIEEGAKIWWRPPSHEEKATKGRKVRAFVAHRTCWRPSKVIYTNISDLPERRERRLDYTPPTEDLYASACRDGDLFFEQWMCAWRKFNSSASTTSELQMLNAEAHYWKGIDSLGAGADT